MHRRRRCTAAAAPLAARSPRTRPPPAAGCGVHRRDISRPLLLAIKGACSTWPRGGLLRAGRAVQDHGGPRREQGVRDDVAEEEDAHADLSGVPDEHLKILDDWYDKLTKKYPTVGRIHFTPAGGTAKREEPADMWTRFDGTKIRITA